MNITRLTGERCRTTRELWEEVFSEDSTVFTDYYYEQKAKDNIGYVVGDFPYEAMLFRTPYDVEIYGKRKQLSYIVGVATRPQHRHKGHMTALLMTAMKEMYQQKQPFAFLMPANPAIYEPFDFEYIYERVEWQFREDDFPRTILEPMMGSGEVYEFFPDMRKIKQAATEEGVLRAAEEGMPWKVAETPIRLYSLRGMLPSRKETEIYRELSEFANESISSHSDIFVYRDEEYYRRQLLELEAQNGDIFVAYEKECICGFFLYAHEEEEIAIQEVVTKQEGMFSFIMEETEKNPVIMGRIIHAEEMLKLIKGEGKKTVLLQIEDDFLPENDGIYRVETTPEGSIVTRLKESRTAEVVVDIRTLTTKLLKNVFINEIV